MAQEKTNPDHITFEQTILQAEEYFKAKDYPAAKRLFEKALDLDPLAKYPKDRLAAIRAVYSDPADVSRFNEAMQKGQIELDRNNFDKAGNWFEVALAAQPDSRAARDKIAETERKKADATNRKEQYDKLMADAERLLSQEKRVEARAVYLSASELIPAETMPRLRVNEIDRWLQEKKTVQDSFEKAIEEGDQFYLNRDFGNAKIKYQEALKIKPDARYPKDMLAKAEQGEALSRSEKENYDATIASADAFYKTGDLDAALSGYRNALAIIPGSDYPAKRISEIEKSIQEKNSRREAFELAIRNGDQEFAGNKLETAARHYQDALTLFPNETHPKKQLSLIDDILARQKADKTKYESLIGTADKAFASQDFSTALSKYQEASDMLPSEQYPVDRIAAINQMISDNKVRQEMYLQSITTGDKLLQEKQYDRAMAAYQEAKSIKPDEQKPIEKIAEISAILDAAKKRNESYNSAIAEGDALFSSQNYIKANESYKAALSIKPQEQYPKKQTEAIASILAENQAKDEAYGKAVADADEKLEKKQYEQAIASYELALSAKPGENYPADQISGIRKTVAEIKTNQENYERSVAEGDRHYETAKFEEALLAFKAASAIRPEEPYPAGKIADIQKKLAEIKARDESYALAIADGDAFFNQKKYREALEPYERALSFKSEESYPKLQKEKIYQFLGEQKKLDDEYNKLVTEGEALLKENSYQPALKVFENARALKPEELLPNERISSIQAILAELQAREEARLHALALEKEMLDKHYADAITEGDQMFARQNYTNAKRAFINASDIKPDEKYPKDKLIEINLILETRAKALKDEYDKVITEADKLYLQKILDQAVEAFEKAASIKPDENYPYEMIRKIKKYIADHAIMEVNTATVVIPSGDEKRFNFRNIEPRLRNNNYVMIRARAIGNTVPKVYFNYGRDNMKNGGIVLRTISTQEGMDYLIRLAGQDKWYREDNNWLSLYTEGSDLEVSRIEISQGE